MNVKDIILQKIHKHGSVKGREILKKVGITRQTLAQHFRELIAEGKISKIGSTRNAKYIKATKLQQNPPEFEKTKRINGLEEDLLFGEADNALRLKTQLSDQTYRIVQYAFTEMVNNAIEHSGAKSVRVSVRFSFGSLCFTVIDRGIGVFENIKKKFGLKDHHEAIDLLLKGKQTTAPKEHSGEGIFFTSRIADNFALKSDRLEFEVENLKRPDMFVSERPKRGKIKGTIVLFGIKTRSRKNLKELFDAYSSSRSEFDKTRITLRLMKKEGSFVSRSEAKRLLYGLDKFRWITIDFKNILGVGQAFADEIFRVFQSAHPEITLEPMNMCEAVKFMLERAKKTTLQ